MTDDDEIPAWDRGHLRTRVYESTTRNGESCLSFYSLQFPGSKGDNGYIRRTDILKPCYTSWGEWDNLTHDAGVSQLEALETDLARDCPVAEETPELRSRITRSLAKPVLSDWKAAQTPFTQNAVEISRPLQLKKKAAAPSQLRLRLKTPEDSGP